ncbi:MAG TPA: ABC transporter permease subunit [Candidatus Bathyarchaeia archaeon]|nr:ABC transporter permease subunit [Candidatus Bathyarchaeia archaeon]
MKNGRRKNKALRRVLLHGALVAGSLVFAAPFIWLTSTSAKVADELYPPRWVPQMPGRVIESPYIGIRENERPERPFQVTKEEWERAQQPVSKAIDSSLDKFVPELPEYVRPWLHEPDVTASVFARLVRRTPDEVFKQQTDAVAASFVQGVSTELISSVFDDVYRRVAMGDTIFYGWDGSIEDATMNNRFPWKSRDENVRLVERTEGMPQAVQEVHYDFRPADRFTLTAEFPLQMPPEKFKKVVVSHHSDRSWHVLWMTVEMAGRKYKSVQPGFLGSDRWQDIAWQIESDADKTARTKTWLRMEDQGPSDFNEPGRIWLTLEVRQAKGIMAAWNKYANNYREAMRMVPLKTYTWNSVLLVLLNVTGQIVGSSLVAYAFSRLHWPGRDFCFILVLATLMVPPQVTMIPVFLIFKNLGWYNSLKPLWVGSFFGSAFFIFLLRQFMKGIPADLEDSAKIDGCGYFGIYRLIILPLIKPALAAIGIFTFMGTWNDFMGPLIYLNDQGLYPLSLGLFALQVFQTQNYGLMMAASVLMTLPVVVLFFAAQRQFIQGITLTGIKG